LLHQYLIPDVSAEIVMDVAKILANSATPMNETDVGACFERPYAPNYITSALAVCSQLGLAEEREGAYSGAELLRSDVKRASKKELFVPFQACLKNYPPFLLYVDFASKGYDSVGSAARTKGIFKIASSLKIVESSLRRWGIYSKLMEVDKKSGKPVLKIDVDRLSAEYVMRLLKAFEAELKAKVFMIDMLGPEVFAYLDQKQIKLDDLTDALLEYETNSKGAASKATQTFELFLWRLLEDSGVGPITGSGPIQLADTLAKQKSVLSNHTHISHGIGGIRNMTHHDPDKESGSAWTISKQGALLTTLLVPATIRSIYLYSKEKKQEF
jgi:hypothetical protein